MLHALHQQPTALPWSSVNNYTYNENRTAKCNRSVRSQLEIASLLTIFSISSRCAIEKNEKSIKVDEIRRVSKRWIIVDNYNCWWNHKEIGFVSSCPLRAFCELLRSEKYFIWRYLNPEKTEKDFQGNSASDFLCFQFVKRSAKFPSCLTFAQQLNELGLRSVFNFHETVSESSAHSLRRLDLNIRRWKLVFFCVWCCLLLSSVFLLCLEARSLCPYSSNVFKL